MSAARIAASMVVLALVLSACGSSSHHSSKTKTSGQAPGTTSTTTSTTSTSKSKTKTKGGKTQTATGSPDLGPAGAKAVASAMNQITLECIDRRKSSKPQGRPTPAFRNDVAVITGLFKGAPNATVTLPGAKKPEPLHDLLANLGVSLATPAPKGCGANAKSGGTAMLSKEIRQSLIAAKQAKPSKAKKKK